MRSPPQTAQGRCLCGAVTVAITTPAQWAWHDHSRRTQKAHGAQAATWVGTWKKRFRIVEGEDLVTRWNEPVTGAVRSFCGRCGTPLTLERRRAPHFINIARPLLDQSPLREPRYHLGFEEAPEWAYRAEPLKPLKGFPGVLWTGARKRRGGGELDGFFR